MLTEEQKEKYLRTLARACAGVLFTSEDFETIYEIMRFIGNEHEVISKEQFDKIFKIEKICKIDDYPIKDCSTTKCRLVTKLEKNIVVASHIDEEKIKEEIKEYTDNEFFNMLNEKLGE